MTDYNWNEVSISFLQTKPATFHKWVWFWQVGRYKVRGWQVEDRTFFKAKVWRELRLADYIYGDASNNRLGLRGLMDQPLFSDGGIARSGSSCWSTKER